MDRAKAIVSIMNILCVLVIFVVVANGSVLPKKLETEEVVLDDVKVVLLHPRRQIPRLRGKRQSYGDFYQMPRLSSNQRPQNYRQIQATTTRPQQIAQNSMNTNTGSAVELNSSNNFGFDENAAAAALAPTAGTSVIVSPNQDTNNGRVSTNSNNNRGTNSQQLYDTQPSLDDNNNPPSQPPSSGNFQSGNVYANQGLSANNPPTASPYYNLQNFGVQPSAYQNPIAPDVNDYYNNYYNNYYNQFNRQPYG